MARKKPTRKRTGARRGQQDEEVERDPIPTLSPETLHGIVVVALFTAGIIGALAFAGIAGNAGAAIAGGLRALFGSAAFLVPLVLLIVAAMLVREEASRPRFGALQLLGFLLLGVALTGLLHLKGGPVSGGYLGLVLSSPLAELFGPIATAVLLTAIVIIGVFLGFHLSLEHVRRAWRTITGAARTARERSQSSADDTANAEFAERELAEKEAEATSNNDGETDEEGAEEANADAQDEDAASSSKHDAIANAVRARKRVRRPRVELPLDLLSGEVGKPTSGDIKAAQAIIQKTLKNFRIDVEMGDVRVGPTVTQFTLRPADGVKLSRITALANDLALALAAHPIRIEAPVPGKSLVGIEVPNQKAAIVRLREILQSDEFTKPSLALPIALGKDVAGHAWATDIARMPHLLVAGATGSGKSVMLNAIIVSLLYRNGPDDLRFILVDPKRVEFPIYNGIPHLLTPVITDVKKTVHALKWALAEMDRRFELLASKRKRDLASYNKACREEDRLPYLVIIIDELADLMAVAANDVEAAIIRLAQMARAVGIHLIVATQRPSVDVITGLIKANITARIAFAVASSIDSRTILDGVGAERLLGRGDMLFTSAELSKPKRLQGCFVSDQEIQRIVECLQERGGNAEYDDEVTEKPIVAFKNGGGDEAEDDLLADAKDVILQAGKASASLLQRRLKVGYARAARILDILEEQGFIGPADGAKPREVFGEQADTHTRPAEPDGRRGGSERVAAFAPQSPSGDVRGSANEEDAEEEEDAHEEDEDAAEDTQEEDVDGADEDGVDEDDTAWEDENEEEADARQR
ncbi:MAG: DNA translocase FtsK 4TM domain-containing protein [bacterium]|nr:DNA translocase FtsK 4TM domain-containing protein [bacterium]